MEQVKSAYIHIPFCRNICTYCDFCKLLYNDKWAFDYLEALEKEIKDRYMGEKLTTIYIGGGTPSALSEYDLDKLNEIIKLFSLASEYEFTFECNLHDINEKLLKHLKKMGVNRLSIGIESFNDKKLSFLGRTASFEDAKEKIDLCNLWGFYNINVDLIYATPKDNLLSLKKELDLFLDLDVPHISTYSLMIEPNTILSYRKTKPINDLLDAKMYELIKKAMENRGLYQYEVSNYATPGYESKHNLTYWNNLEYYGFGLSASGYLDGIRYTNTYSLKDYLNGNYTKDEEIISKDDKITYEIILGLRKIKGINTQEFYNKYKQKLEEKDEVKQLIMSKDLIYKNGNIFINPDKLYIMNEILIKLV